MCILGSCVPAKESEQDVVVELNVGVAVVASTVSHDDSEEVGTVLEVEEDEACDVVFIILMLDSSQELSVVVLTVLVVVV